MDNKMRHDKNMQENPEFEGFLASVLSEKEEPRAEILSQIMQAIEWKNYVSARRRVFAFASALAASLPLFFLVVRDLWGQLVQSGIFQMLSLLFSDSKLILANWESFTLSLLESFPVIPVVSTLAVTALFLLSAKLFLDNLAKSNLHFRIKNHLLI